MPIPRWRARASIDSRKSRDPTKVVAAVVAPLRTRGRLAAAAPELRRVGVERRHLLRPDRGDVDHEGRHREVVLQVAEDRGGTVRRAEVRRALGEAGVKARVAQQRVGAPVIGMPVERRRSEHEARSPPAQHLDQRVLFLSPGAQAAVAAIEDLEHGAQRSGRDRGLGLAHLGAAATAGFTRGEMHDADRTPCRGEHARACRRNRARRRRDERPPRARRDASRSRPARPWPSASSSRRRLGIDDLDRVRLDVELIEHGAPEREAVAQREVRHRQHALLRRAARQAGRAQRLGARAHGLVAAYGGRRWPCRRRARARGRSARASSRTGARGCHRARGLRPSSDRARRAWSRAAIRCAPRRRRDRAARTPRARRAAAPRA